jgi:HK97 gp10 family phage protein
MSDVKYTNRASQVLSALETKKAQALEAIGARAETHAKSNTPVDTGNLRNSMAHAVSGDSVYIGSNVEYAPYVEFGTRRNKAHHMLQKAATGHGDEYKAIAKAALGG